MLSKLVAKTNQDNKRTKAAHLAEEYAEVLNFTDRSNAVEEIGDLLYTAMAFINSKLPDDVKEIDLIEVLACNQRKLIRSRRRRQVYAD
jgi:NTP pyrophosphatase (non-canonical NTP hydrolase)